MLVAASLKLEENGPRLMAARVQLLDDAIAAWRGGVGIWVQDQKPLEQIKELLVADGPGKAEVKLNMMVKDHAVSIALPGNYKLSGDFRQNLRRVSGVLDVREL